jgi:hypothetical protein
MNKLIIGKQNIYNVLIILLLATLLSLNFFMFENSKKTTFPSDVEAQSAVNIGEKLGNMSLSLNNDGLFINTNFIEIYKKNNKISENEPIFVIRYSQYACNSCKDFIFRIVSRYVPNYENNTKILFVTSDYLNNSKKLPNNSIYLEDANLLGLPAEEFKELPFFFVYNSRMVFHLFSPNQSTESELIDLYFTEINNRYSIF